jgi:hypothetical protein
MSDAPKKVSAKDFSLFAWAATIPLTDDLWLRMQAQNIAVVDMTMLRPMEERALEEFFEHDRISSETTHNLSAISQMWIFSLYEFMRTWLARASNLIGYSERVARHKTDEERTKEMNAIKAALEERAKYVKIGRPFLLDQAERVNNREFIDSIRSYRDSIKGLYREVEAIRMPLAKHEIASNERYFAEAPGYGGVSFLTGSMHWQIANTDGTVEMIERRRLADKFLCIKTPLEEEKESEEGVSEEDMKWLDQMFGPEGKAKPQIARMKRRRRGRRGGRRKRKQVNEKALHEPVVAAEGEWPFKDQLMIVPRPPPGQRGVKKSRRLLKK